MQPKSQAKDIFVVNKYYIDILLISIFTSHYMTITLRRQYAKVEIPRRIPFATTVATSSSSAQINVHYPQHPK